MILRIFFFLIPTTAILGVGGFLFDPRTTQHIPIPTSYKHAIKTMKAAAVATSQFKGSITEVGELPKSPPPQHVVIVGGGIGGLSTAFDARHLLRKDDKITVVSDRSHFEFTPSNAWVVVHMRTPQQIC
jgi:hypothetical protein